MLQTVTAAYIERGRRLEARTASRILDESCEVAAVLLTASTGYQNGWIFCIPIVSSIACCCDKRNTRHGGAAISHMCLISSKSDLSSGGMIMMIEWLRGRTCQRKKVSRNIMHIANWIAKIVDIPAQPAADIGVGR